MALTKISCQFQARFDWRGLFSQVPQNPGAVKKFVAGNRAGSAII